jgi:hypothetical protein
MDSHPDVNVTATDFNSSALLFSGLGIPFGNFVNDMNKFASHGEQLNDSTIVPTGQLFEEMYLYSIFWMSAQFGSTTAAIFIMMF